MNSATTELHGEQLETISSMLKAVAHPVRLSILLLLDKNTSMSVNDICEAIGSEQSLTSHHLSNMKLKGIISSQRQGQRVFYSIKFPHIPKLLRCLEDCSENL